ncbi:MAG: aconitate hydratase AcnA [Candidatus Marinimicrobia bacterium]|nr:aconitate hydratase AcnA [Candidatus Neomarinimicrobiota bacterium]MCF7839808.1 aconitate hydratase AcnA [Candidatus Neomarinimicrobiota bacterium]MCF7901842.1 aconitate hydratase AcnA [Candidatus Neomarinimicrobiota bacterium]
MSLTPKSLDSFKTRSTLTVQGKSYIFYDLKKLGADDKLARLPVSIKILLENMLRYEDGETVTRDDVLAILNYDPKTKPSHEIAFRPARVLLQDFTGVPAVVDLAVMRDAIKDLDGDPERINPMLPADLVIDHSVQVDKFGSPDAFAYNANIEIQRNRERYEFLRWGQKAFENFRVVPPDTGIVHQVNLEYLAKVAFTKETAEGTEVYPDSLVGTDSHTTMINGLGVMGWGVGGIEAEAGMLGQPVTMLIPQVVGFRLTGQLAEGVTATDLVLTVTQILRTKGVVGKFVEYFGPGLQTLSLEDKATIANMSPEYGATMGFFPVNDKTLDYMRFTGRPDELVTLTEAYTKANTLFVDGTGAEPQFTDVVELDLSTVEPSLAGPKRPQDRVPLRSSKTAWQETLPGLKTEGPSQVSVDDPENGSYEIKHGDVVIAAITSCTNTSNPSVLIAAGLLAKKAVEKGLVVKPWVKTSLAPGSKVVTEYLNNAGLTPYLDELRFNLVGYGCTTCIGNSGPLPEHIARAVVDGNLVVSSILSGNRNFEGRVNPHTKANYLASPPLVVAYALAGTMDIDLYNDPIGMGSDGEYVYLKDIWPTTLEVAETLRSAVTSEQFRRKYSEVFQGDDAWQSLPVPEGSLYKWMDKSTYIRKPSFFDGMTKEIQEPEDIQGARLLALLGDSVTTDHISPAGAFSKDTPAGQYLMEHGVELKDFNSYGSRRGNHEVMMRGTFANIRLRNRLAPGTEGGWTRYQPDDEQMTIFDAAMKYQEKGVPLVVIAGKEYGTGSSRDWAAKGTFLLGVKAVIAESFERIHRSNLIGMGVLPLQFKENENQETLGLTGKETYTITGIADNLQPGKELTVTATANSGETKTFTVDCRIDTPNELSYYRHGGILQYVLRSLIR